MPRKDLRLPIKRRVIAILADQHLCEKCRRRQAAGDQPFGRRRLHDLATGAAGVFPAGDTNNTKLGRNPIEHLADALPDRVERAAATTADLAINVEQNVLARQMIGQRLAPGWRLGCLCCDRRAVLPDAGNIAVEIFKCERQLIGIEAFGATPELRPLQLLDDDLETLNLAVAALDNISHLTHQMVQQSRIGWQIFEVKSLFDSIRIC